MSEPERVQAPSAAEIARRFHSPAVLAARPVILGGLGVLGAVRRFRWTAQGAHKLLRYERPLIFVSNHCSHADTAAILGTLPLRIRRRVCVAAALDVFGPAGAAHKRTLKAFRRECLQIIVAAGFHAFAFDRHSSPLRSMRTAVDLIDDGWNMLLYPEGTRSRTGEMASFKPGACLLARKTGRPVIPVHVTGGADVLPCGTFMPRSGHVFVRYGGPMWPEEGESASAFADRLEQRVRALGVSRRAAAVAAESRPEGRGRLASLRTGNGRY